MTPNAVFLLCTGLVIILLLGSTCFFPAPSQIIVQRYTPKKQAPIQMHVIGGYSSDEEA